MDYKKGWLGIVLAGLWLVLPLLPQKEENKTSPQKPPVETRPLVRKDLLNFGESIPPPSLRNIFRPKPARSQNPARRAPVAPRPAAKTPPREEQPQAFALTLNYIGSVQSGGRTMALVIRSGEAVPVAEGEEIVPGYRVIRITPEEIEVEGPGGERKVFSRQGER